MDLPSTLQAGRGGPNSGGGAPRASAWSMPTAVTTATRSPSAGSTLVASLAPPSPASITATSTASS